MKKRKKGGRLHPWGDKLKRRQAQRASSKAYLNRHVEPWTARSVTLPLNRSQPTRVLFAAVNHPAPDEMRPDARPWGPGR